MGAILSTNNTNNKNCSRRIAFCDLENMFPCPLSKEAIVRTINSLNKMARKKKFDIHLQSPFVNLDQAVKDFKREKYYVY